MSPRQFIGVLFVLFCPIGFTEQISNAHKIVTLPVYADEKQYKAHLSTILQDSDDGIIVQIVYPGSQFTAS